MAAITPLPLDITLQTGALVPLLNERVGNPGDLNTKVDDINNAAVAARERLQDPNHGLAAIRGFAERGATAAAGAESEAKGARTAAEAAKSELQDPNHGLAAIKAASVASTELRIACYLDDLESLFHFADDRLDEVRGIYESDFKIRKPYREGFINEVGICFGASVQNKVRSAHAELDRYVTGSQRTAGGQQQVDRFGLTSHLRAMRQALVVG